MHLVSSVDPPTGSKYNRRMTKDEMTLIQAGVVTVSDKASEGERKDVSGQVLADLLRKIGMWVVKQTIVPDEQDEIERVLIGLADEAQVDLIVTTGGTGLTPRDVTPEATQAVIEREAPGLAEVLRFEGYHKTPLAALSRGVAGVRGRTLIINLPGSPRAVREGMETLSPILPHAVKMVRGVDTEHGKAEVTLPEVGVA
jgi:molybdopterin adenylyltransferase